MNRCNIVTWQQAKGADRLEPKRYEVRYRGFIVLCRRCGTSGVEAAPNRLGYLSGTRKPRIPPIFGKAPCKGKPMGVRAQEDGKNKRRSVMNRIRVQTLPGCESRQTSTWCFFVREFGESSYEGKQMTVSFLSTDAPSGRHICQKTSGEYRKGCYVMFEYNSRVFPTGNGLRNA